MQTDGFSWWLQRLEHHFKWFDLVRIDHFRGLEAIWVINADCDTAIDGHWEKTPGDDLLATLLDQSNNNESLPLVAEDLGLITPEVIALRKKYALPGMAILQFSFDHFDDNPHKPKNIQADCVAYTGTHDNNTSQGWFDALSQEEKQHVMRVLSVDKPEDVLSCMINTVLESYANLAILPLQDILGLGAEARMNIPGTVENNWQWQCKPTDLSPDLANKLHALLEKSHRIPAQEINEHG
jgi:4-alpha-glucanotransferase